MSESIQLMFDTRSSLQPTTPHNTSWYVKEPILNSARGFSVALKEIIIPNLVYPINAYNNKIYVTETTGSLSFTATITPGNYDSSSIEAAVGTAITTASAASGNTWTYTCTYAGDDTQTLSISTGDVLKTFIFTSGSNSAYYALGFASADYGTASDTLNGSLPIQLQGTDFVDVTTNFGNRNYNSKGFSHTLDRIKIDVGFGDVVFHNNVFLPVINITNEHCDKFEMRLLDSNGNPYVLPENANVSITLLFSGIVKNSDTHLLAFPSF